jgi:hypothetical protein
MLRHERVTVGVKKEVRNARMKGTKIRAVVRRSLCVQSKIEKLIADLSLAS